MLAVPSFSTLQSLRKSIIENGNTCPLTQKHIVQLDWVSKEDGSHILTVAVGSKVICFLDFKRNKNSIDFTMDVSLILCIYTLFRSEIML